jgi:plastocyanin
MAFSTGVNFATVAAMNACAAIRPSPRRLALAASASLVTLVLTLAIAAASPASTDLEVSIVSRAYQPATLTVTAGQTVTWTNHALTPHTVTAVGGQFDSGRIDPGESFTVTFATPGTFAYTCTIHPSMHGSVVVLAAGASPGAPAEAVRVSLSRKRGVRGELTLVRVRAPRPGAKALLQLRSPHGGSWITTRRAQLSSSGTATFTLSASVHRPLRVLVDGSAGHAPLVGAALRPPA